MLYSKVWNKKLLKIVHIKKDVSILVFILHLPIAADVLSLLVSCILTGAHLVDKFLLLWSMQSFKLCYLYNCVCVLEYRERLIDI